MLEPVSRCTQLSRDCIPCYILVEVKVPLQTDNFDHISICILHPITAKVKYVSEFFLLCMIKY